MTVCAACGAENPDDARFCMSCGAALAAPSPIAEERKVVTTLFCDLVGFTAMSDAADPEDVAAVLGRYHEAARKLIESHGGTVEKFIGDAVVGVFGVPAVHDDDPERAVRTGLRLLEALGGLTRPDGTALEARCGVNTGEALVRLDVDPLSGRGFLTGDAVNVAARLQAAAPPNGVAVGARTHDLTVRTIDYESLPPVVAKGKRQPVVAYRALRPFSRTGLRTSGPMTTPFLGRAGELAALHDALREASRVHAARFVLLVGEPGIGKSRLVLEFARSLDERPDMVTWRQGRCLPYGEGVTFWALGEIVKAQVGILDSDVVATVEAKLDAAVPQEEEDRAWLLQRLRPLLGLEAPQAARAENVAAWTLFLERVASARPTVLVLEDLHWAGEAMLAFVEHLLSRDLDVPLLVVATARPELLQRHEGALTARTDDGRLRHITLPTLSEQDTRALITHLLDRDLAAEAGARIADLAGGNPLFAEQYVRLLGDRGEQAPIPDGGDPATSAGLPLPETVQAVLAARLDTLPPWHKALLCDAAVIGETFWCGAVAALSGREPDVVDEAMAALAVRDFVRPVTRPTVEGESEYLFWHALARDVAYGQLPRMVRARKHAAAAQWIERKAGERVDDLAEIIAHHYDVALDLAVAAGDTARASSLAVPTIEALARAGDRALRLDVAAAERHFAHALALAGPEAAERLRLLPRWAETLLLRNRYREAVAACEEAVAGCRACGDTRGEAVATRWLADAAAFLNEPAWDLMRRAADLVVEDEPSREQVDVLAHFALSHLLTGRDPQVAIAVAERAIESASSLELAGPAMAISVRGLARLNLGDLGGLKDNLQAIAAARAQGLGSDRATIEFNAADALFGVGGARVSYEAMVEAMEFARSHGLAAFVLACRAGLVAILMRMGQWDRAMAEIGDLVPQLEGAEDVWDVVFLRSVQAEMLVWRGDVDEAALFVDWLTAQGRETEVGWTRGYALLAASAVRCGLGDAATTRSLLAECFDRPRVAMDIVDRIPHAARIALGAGDVELAAAVVRAAESELPESKLPLWQHAMTTAGALLAEARGEPEAAPGFATAASGWRDFEMPYEEAQALLGQGRCLIALGRAPEAAPVLQHAREIFAWLKARPALDETETLLRAV